MCFKYLYDLPLSACPTHHCQQWQGSRYCPSWIWRGCKAASPPNNLFWAKKRIRHEVYITSWDWMKLIAYSCPPVLTTYTCLHSPSILILSSSKCTLNSTPCITVPVSVTHLHTIKPLFEQSFDKGCIAWPVPNSTRPRWHNGESDNKGVWSVDIRQGMEQEGDVGNLVKMLKIIIAFKASLDHTMFQKTMPPKPLPGHFQAGYRTPYTAIWHFYVHRTWHTQHCSHPWSWHRSFTASYSILVAWSKNTLWTEFEQWKKCKKCRIEERMVVISDDDKDQIRHDLIRCYIMSDINCNLTRCNWTHLLVRLQALTKLHMKMET